MKKIISGISAIFVTLAIVGGAAYAAFTSTATVSGIELRTGSAGLQIDLDLNGYDGYASSATLPAGAFIKLIPGEDDWGKFKLKNNSDSSAVDPLNLDLSAQLVSANGDWDVLKENIEAVVYKSNSSANAGVENSTGWRKLSEWNAGAVSLPGVLAPNQEQEYIVRYQLVQSADNSVAGKTISNVQFVFTGTQE